MPDPRHRRMLYLRAALLLPFWWWWRQQELSQVHVLPVVQGWTVPAILSRPTSPIRRRAPRFLIVAGRTAQRHERHDIRTSSTSGNVEQRPVADFPTSVSLSPNSSPSTTTTDSLSSTSSSTTSNDATTTTLSPLEDWCARSVEAWYQKAVAVKCPFFKRRFVDALDALDSILVFLVIRHKSLDLFGPPPGHRSKLSQVNNNIQNDRINNSEDSRCDEHGKRKHLSLTELREAIARDWRVNSGHKGYYITGQLNTTIVRDDCLFDGPDPDMPVRGLRKYLGAASQLFDRKQSQAELLSLTTERRVVVSGGTSLPSQRPQHQESPISDYIIVARWRMNGVLRLPWKPRLPEWTGTTTYHLDDDGLIYWHEEEWDMSVGQAFLKTFAPEIAERFWPTPLPSQQP